MSDKISQLDYSMLCQDQTKLSISLVVVLFMNWKPTPLINHPLTGGGETQRLGAIKKSLHGINFAIVTLQRPSSLLIQNSSFKIITISTSDILIQNN